MPKNQKNRHLRQQNGIRLSIANRFWALCAFLTIAFSPSYALAFAEERIVAVVNGTAVTSSDVTSYGKIIRLLSGGKKIPKGRALTEAIETHLKIQESKTRNVTPTDAEVEKRISAIAAAQKRSSDSLLNIMKKKGIDTEDFRKFVGGEIGWSKIIRRDYGKRIDIDEASVQKGYNKIKNNPKPGIRLAQLRNVLLPIEKGASRQVVGARIAEARNIVARFKTCSRLKSITDDIYNVRIGKTKEIPLKALNPKARQVLRKAGPGKIFINGISPKLGGLQMTAYCGNRTLKAPVPSLEQYKNRVFFDQMQQYSVRHMKKVKDLAIIEIKGK